jgi:hypothetical protein
VVGDNQILCQGTYSGLLRDPVVARSITELEKEGEDGKRNQGEKMAEPPSGNGNGPFLFKVYYKFKTIFKSEKLKLILKNSYQIKELIKIIKFN